MSLNIEPRTGGDFIPWVKYNAKSGRVYTKNEAGDEVEVVNFTAIWDLENIKTGWTLFENGVAPSVVFDVNGTPAPQPSAKHKRGFAVSCFSPKELGGLRELMSNSNASIIAVKDLHDRQFEKAPERQKGLVPVVKLVRVVPIKSRQGTNFQPEFKIERWVARPPGLTASVAGPAAAAAPNADEFREPPAPEPAKAESPEEF